MMNTAEHGPVPVVDVAATLTDGAGAAFLVNRNPDEEVRVELRLQNLRRVSGARHAVLHDAERGAVNTADEPDRVVPTTQPVAQQEDGRLSVVLPPCSWSTVTFQHAS
jgi:alpha-N-arabinofuranosidase